MSHLMEQSISYRAVTSWRNNFVRHLRSRHSHTAFPIPRSVDLGFLIIRPLRGRWVICYIIPIKIRMQADWKKVSTCILTLDHNRLFIYSTFTCYASCFCFFICKDKEKNERVRKKVCPFACPFCPFQMDKWKIPMKWGIFATTDECGKPHVLPTDYTDLHRKNKTTHG